MVSKYGYRDATIPYVSRTYIFGTLRQYGTVINTGSILVVMSMGRVLIKQACNLYTSKDTCTTSQTAGLHGREKLYHSFLPHWESRS